MPWPQTNTNGSPLTKALGPIAAKMAGDINPSQLVQALGPLAAQFANGKLQTGQLAQALGPLASQMGNPQIIQLAKAAYDNIQKNPDGMLAKAFKGLVGNKTDQTKEVGCAANGSCPVQKKATATWAPAQTKSMGKGPAFAAAQKVLQQGPQVLQRQQEQWENGYPQKAPQVLQRQQNQWENGYPQKVGPQVLQRQTNGARYPQKVAQVVNNARQTWQDASVPRLQNAKQTWDDRRSYDRDHSTEPCRPCDIPDRQMGLARQREQVASKCGAGGGCPIKQRAYQAAEQSPCALRAKMQSAMQSPCALRAAARAAEIRPDLRESGIQPAWQYRQNAMNRGGCGWGKWASADQDLPPTRVEAEGVFGAADLYDNQVEWIPKTYNYVQPAASPECSLGSYASCQQKEVAYNPTSYAALY
jgi:hypothetical protein